MPDDVPDEHRDVPDEHCDVPDEHRDVPDEHCDVPDEHRLVPDEPAAAFDPEARLREIITDLIAELESRGARDEALAVPKSGRGIGPFRTSSSMAPVGRAWRLGVLLVDREGNLYATGKLTRAVEPGWPQSLSGQVEQRRADRLAASKGRFHEGEVVNYEWSPLGQDARSLRDGLGPVFVEGDRLVVRWSSAGTRALEPYLAERLGLLDLETTFDPGEGDPEPDYHSPDSGPPHGPADESELGPEHEPDPGSGSGSDLDPHPHPQT